MEQANNYIKNIINTQRTFFNSNKTKDITFRKKMLCKLKKAIKHNEKKILRALYHDLGKSKAESYMSEIAMVYHEIDTALSHIEKWSRPMHAAGDLKYIPCKKLYLQRAIRYSPYPRTVELPCQSVTLPSGRCDCSRKLCHFKMLKKQSYDLGFNSGHY